jgi:pyrroloquinoline quinone biosynthesis protein B
MVWAPQIGHWDDGLKLELDAASTVLVDGTFWTEDEMSTAGVGRIPAADMGHLPLGGEEGLAVRVAGTAADRKLLVHINNTNPIHDPSSPQRQTLTALGVEVAHAGLTLEI